MAVTRPEWMFGAPRTALRGCAIGFLQAGCPIEDAPPLGQCASYRVPVLGASGQEQRHTERSESTDSCDGGRALIQSAVQRSTVNAQKASD